MPPKIAIIGAGSAVFSLRMIGDLCLTPGLAGATVSLMDIDPQRLAGVHQLALRYADEAGASLNIEATSDRRTALDGADFVILTALASPHHRWKEGWSIAKELGYRFGGSLHVMHDEAFWINFYQYRLFESVARDMLELCPDALLLLVANPVLAGTTWLPRRFPDLKLVGLCHGFSQVYALADLLGLDRQGLTWELSGVNHHLWLGSAFHNGRDLYPMIDEWLDTSSEDYWKTVPSSHVHGPKPFDAYQRFGRFPIGDTCNPGGGAWGWWYHTDAATQKRWKEDPDAWFDRYFQLGDESVATVARFLDNPGLKISDTLPMQPSSESMVPLIESIACDIPRKIVVNIPNSNGFVPGIPLNFSCEISAMVSKRGLQGIQSQPLPSAITTTILRDRVAPVELELEAYETASREALLQLILSDPWTQNEQQANGLIDAILALPYHQEMREHYR